MTEDASGSTVEGAVWPIYRLGADKMLALVPEDWPHPDFLIPVSFPSGFKFRLAAWR